MPTPGRRERNKARTRATLLAALRDEARERGVGDLTVEAITDRADVARRTFFNYFSSIDAAIAEAMAPTLDELAEAFLAQPAEHDPLTAIIDAITQAPISTELLSWLVFDDVATNGMSPLHIQVWKHHETWLVGVLHERLGAAAEALAVASLAATVMAVFDVTCRRWLTEVRDLDEAATKCFNTLLLAALRHVQDGWRATTSPTPDTR